MTENTQTTQTPDETPGVDWSAGELRALAAENVYRFGVGHADLEETNDEYREVAGAEWGDHRAPTDAELEEVRGYMRRAVIDIDGMRYGDEDGDELTVAGCSCGMADYGAPGHEGHPDFDAEAADMARFELTQREQGEDPEGDARVRTIVDRLLDRPQN